MRWILVALALLGLLVAALGMFERSVQVNQWSSLIAWAQETGVLQNERFAQRLGKLPPSPFTTVITLVGTAITLLAMWCLSIQDRSK